MSKVPLFHCNQPCGNCPYRTDAPLKLWHRSEYEKLLDNEHNYLGSVYMCHKKNGSACIGWMMKQYEQNFPSIRLRLAFAQENIPQAYFDSLNSPAPLYKDVPEMIKANYPDILKGRKKDKELLRIVTQFQNGILNKASTKDKCWIVCAPLQGFLHGCGYYTKLVEGYLIINNKRYHHFWLEYLDIIIDPTASQFKKPDGSEMPEVFLGPKPDWYIFKAY